MMSGSGLVRAAIVFVLLVVAASTAALAQHGRKGVVGEPAPTWGVDQWINLPAGRESLDIGDYKGKVLYLYGFQTGCPGCHSHGFPTLTALIDHYEGDDGVAFVAIQTAFETFGINSFDGARRTAQRYHLTIPVGHSGSALRPSPMMRKYRTGGTPWTIIIDKEGVVRSNGFFITVEQATGVIDAMRSEGAGE